MHFQLMNKQFQLRAPEDDPSNSGNTKPAVVTQLNPLDPKAYANPAPEDRPVTRYELELRREAEVNRKKAQEVEDKLNSTNLELENLKKQLEAKEVENTTKLQTEIEKLNQEHVSKIHKAQVRAAVKELLLDPDEINTLDLSSIKFDENGKPEGLDQFVEDLRAKRPYWFKDYHQGPSSTAARANRSPHSTNTAPELDALKLDQGKYEEEKRALLRQSSLDAVNKR